MQLGLGLLESRERVTGIEPAWPAWKAGALPLSYTRVLHLSDNPTRLPQTNG